MTASKAPGLTESRTLKNLASLDADTRAMAEALVAEMWNEHGLDFRVTSGTRTMAEQAKLYAQGRTAAGPKVTNARPGYSWHNFGVAFDITLFKGGKPVWEGKEYDTAGGVGRRIGLEWGGAWQTFKDRPHFQKKMGMTLAEARAKYGTK
jgi:peptidoglycan LD-endopeptidase CwlK